MEKILIATNNDHKVDEFRQILKILDIDAELVSPKDLNDHSEPVVDGNSYE